MTELSENARLALESLETKPALNTPALIAQNEGIERSEAEEGLAELKAAGIVKNSAMGWKLKKPAGQ
jgi:DNA-binding IscR family transcriptional regulator